MDDSTLREINKTFQSDYTLTEEISEGIANINFLLINTKGDKLIARILREQKPGLVPLEAELQDQLAISGLGTPRLLKKKDGSPILLQAGKHTLTFTKFIESEPFDQASDELIKNMGRSLAEFQLALKDFDKSKIPPNYLSKAYQDKLHFKDEDIEIAETIKIILAELYSQLNSLNLPKSIIHGDLNEGNFLQNKGSIIAILDLETTEYTYRVLDLCIIVYYRSADQGRTYQEVSKLITEGFEEISPLTQAEKDAMPLATAYSATCFSLWSLANDPGDKSDFLESFNRLQNRIKAGFKL
jgi:Ser/Thr protein kinase RdoA (MazF antagonist)